MKTLFTLLVALLFNVVAGSSVAFAAGFDPGVGAGVAVGISLLPVQYLTPGVLPAGVLREVWTGELINKFRHQGTFLSAIQGRNELVNNDVIHLVDVGADPAVLINNTTYPISIAQRTDSDVPISLDKFDTENTAVSDDELYAITYDKIGSVVEQHVNTLEDATIEKALHALAPAGDASGTPVFRTTGADNGGGKKRLTVADVIGAKRRLDDLGVPKRGRHLVLCNQHVEDLLTVSENFREQYANIREGQILRLHGFNIHEESYNPVYNDTGLTKAAYGAAPAGTDRDASVFFYAGRAFKARGSAQMYFEEAANNPQYRRNVAGFRLHFICLPKKNEGFGAIVNADVV